jgi:hypothetical protein
MQTSNTLQVLCGDRALEQLKKVIPPDNLISRLGGNSEYDPYVTDLGFPLDVYPGMDTFSSKDCFNTSTSLKAETRNGSAESTLTSDSLDVDFEEKKTR